MIIFLLESKKLEIRFNQFYDDLDYTIDNVGDKFDLSLNTFC